MKGEYKILVGKLKEKRLLRRSMHRWKDNIKMNLTKIWLKDVN
jgi:hypothetical protein